MTRRSFFSALTAIALSPVLARLVEPLRVVQEQPVLSQEFLDEMLQKMVQVVTAQWEEGMRASYLSICSRPSVITPASDSLA